MENDYRTFTGPEGREFTVAEGASHTPSVYINVDEGDKDAYGWLPAEDVPAFALAALEAAAYEETGAAQSNIVHGLRLLVADQSKRKAESEEAAKLDAEAKALYEAAAEPFVASPWDDLNEHGRKWWRTVARKAREIHGAEAAK